MKDLACKASMEYTTIAAIERGDRPAGAKVGNQIANALNLSGRERDGFLVAALGTTVRERLPSMAIEFDPEIFRPIWKLLADQQIVPSDIRRVSPRLVVDDQSPDVDRKGMLALAVELERRAQQIQAGINKQSSFTMAELALELANKQFLYVAVTAVKVVA